MALKKDVLPVPFLPTRPSRKLFTKQKSYQVLSLRGGRHDWNNFAAFGKKYLKSCP
jgi:hypothetical protein